MPTISVLEMTGKVHSQEAVRITAKPFLIIASVLIALILIGSLANNIRMKKRFDSLMDHSMVIYNAHSTEIESLIDNLSNIENTLGRINNPEKGIYYVDLILNVNGSWILYDEQGSGLKKTNISQEEINLVKNYITLDNSVQFSFQDNLKDFYGNFYKPYPHYNKDFLVSVIPISQGGKEIGYFIVATSKVQSN